MPKVLVADDVPDNVRLLAFDLADEGYDVLTAYNGHQALEIAETESPDVILLDVMMPGLDGFEICRRLKANPELASTPIVLVTARNLDKDVVEGLNAGASDYVTKPYNSRIVLARVRSALRGKKSYDLAREMNQRLDMARRAAESASRSKSEFLASMSHEIRTPLTAILGYADLLLDPDSTPSERSTWIQTIRRSGEHLLCIINDVLDLSKIEAGRMTVERIPVAPLDLLAGIASLMGRKAREKGLDFEIVCPGELPQTIQSDPTRLRQILVNLTGNAIKFTQHGSVKVVCRLMDPVDAPDPRIGFEVIDTGIGLSDEQRHELFEPFQQADGTVARKFGGTGLGLAISRRFAEMLGGDIVCDSTQGSGSLFRATVATGPLKGVMMVKGELLAPIDDHEPEKSTPPEVTLSGRVLLAEDVPANQKLISFHLKKTGLDVEVAENGLEAVEKAKYAVAAGQPFDLIIMDMQLPKLDGYTAASQIRSEGCDTSIVALTAHAMKGEREKSLRAGCDDFATKPIDRNTLLSLVARWLKKPSSRSSSRREEPEKGPEIVVDDEATPRPRGKAGPEPLYSELLETTGATDPELIRMVESFIRELPPQIAEFEEKLDRGDFDAIAALAHQLKGAGGGFGFPLVSEVADRLEHVSRTNQDASWSRTLLGDLRLLARRLVAKRDEV